MKAFKCDRCGTFYEPYNYRFDENKINGMYLTNLNPVRDIMHGPYDLCPSCSTELVNWFKRSSENNNGESS